MAKTLSIPGIPNTEGGTVLEKKNETSTAENSSVYVQTEKGNFLKMMLKILILTTLATVLTALKADLSFAPAYITLDFSAVVILLTSFKLDPLIGIIVTILKDLITVLIVGTTTCGVGEFIDCAAIILLAFPAAVIYENRRDAINAAHALALGVVIMTITTCILNYFILIPFYAKILVSMDDIIAEANAVNPKVTDLKSMIFHVILPYNLMKGGINSLVAFALRYPAEKLLNI